MSSCGLLTGTAVDAVAKRIAIKVFKKNMIRQGEVLIIMGRYYAGGFKATRKVKVAGFYR